MELLTLAIVLTFIQAAPPVPRQTADNGSAIQQPVQDHPKSDKKPAESPPVKQAATAKPDQNPNAANSPETHEKPVDIGKLPPVSVNRDFIDYLGLGLTCTLLLVGIFGVIAAYRTLRAVESQAAIMRGQLTQMKSSGEQTDKIIGHASSQASALRDAAAAMQESAKVGRTAATASLRGMVLASKNYEMSKASVEAAQKSANAALLNANSLKNAERAWVDAELVRPSAIYTTTYSLNVTHHGKSQAVILSFKYARHGYASMKDIPESFDAAHGVWTQHTVNQILPVGARRTIFEFDIREWQDDLSRSQIPIHRAVVSYKDIFGDEHETEVVYRYDGEKLGLAHLRRYNRLT